MISGTDAGTTLDRFIAAVQDSYNAHEPALVADLYAENARWMRLWLWIANELGLPSRRTLLTCSQAIAQLVRSTHYASFPSSSDDAQGLFLQAVIFRCEGENDDNLLRLHFCHAFAIQMPWFTNSHVTFFLYHALLGR